MLVPTDLEIIIIALHLLNYSQKMIIGIAQTIKIFGVGLLGLMKL
jgi:hypothetical protein